MGKLSAKCSLLLIICLPSNVSKASLATSPQDGSEVKVDAEANVLCLTVYVCGMSHPAPECVVRNGVVDYGMTEDIFLSSGWKCK